MGSERKGGKNNVGTKERLKKEGVGDGKKCSKWRKIFDGSRVSCGKGFERKSKRRCPGVRANKRNSKKKGCGWPVRGGGRDSIEEKGRIDRRSTKGAGRFNSSKFQAELTELT